VSWPRPRILTDLHVIRLSDFSFSSFVGIGPSQCRALVQADAA
jgi:hypothetical protein